MAQQLAQATHGFQAGTHAVTDVYEARSRRDLATAQRVAARNDLASRRADLEKVVGPVPYPLATLRPEVAIPQPQPNEIQLNIPLFAGGATTARVNEAIANQHKARAHVETARRQGRPMHDRPMRASRTACHKLSRWNRP